MPKCVSPTPTPLENYNIDDSKDVDDYHATVLYDDDDHDNGACSGGGDDAVMPLAVVRS